MTLTLVDFERNFNVVWAEGWRREIALEFIEKTKGNPAELRICTISTQHHCVSLVATDGKGKFVPFEYRENQWRKLYPHKWRVDKFDPRCLESEEEFQRVLERQMLLQFPDQAIGYYDEFPSAEAIKGNLREGFRVCDLAAYRYTVYEANVQRDPEWDGAIQILCDGGCLLVPYYGEQKYLIPKYATFKADSVGDSLLSKVGAFFEGISGFFVNLHWSDFRRHIDELGGNKNV